MFFKGIIVFMYYLLYSKVNWNYMIVYIIILGMGDFR